MTFFEDSKLTTTKFPLPLVILTIAVCLAPLILGLFGFDFGTHIPPLDFSQVASMDLHERADFMHYQLVGSFTHTLLEWTAFLTALFTVILSFVHFRIKQEIVTPIIGIALFSAGTMDAFHTLAADRLISTVTDSQNLIPFTWAICRIFNALILIAGVGILMIQPKKQLKMGFGFVICVSAFFGCLAYFIIYYSATSAQLPQTMYPYSLFSRPFDVAPLLLFLFGGLYLFPKFYRKSPSFFSHALIVSMIPQVVTQIHVAFGSVALFDNHFNIAHFLKIIAYLVPFLGLLLDYHRTYRIEVLSKRKLKRSKQLLELQKKDLEKVNKELDNFAHTASHDLQAPLRGISYFSGYLKKNYSTLLDKKGKDYLAEIQKGATRMDQLINDLLALSQITRIQNPFEDVPMGELINSILRRIQFDLDMNKVEIKVQKDLPIVHCDRIKMGEVFSNLIHNAVKFSSKGKDKNSIVEIGCEEEKEGFKFFVKDNGIGIDPKNHDRIFEIFQRLHTEEEFEGTGAGLSIVKHAIDDHEGKVWLKSEIGKGATFYFTIPKVFEQRGRLLKELSVDLLGDNEV